MSADTVRPPSASVATMSAQGKHAKAVVIGVVVGLTWGAALRGWMVQLAGAESRFSWLTLGVVMLPAATLGALLGHASDARARGAAPPKFLVWTPLLLLAVLLDPEMFLLLVRSGYGGGSVLVVATGLSGGYLLTHWRFSLWTVLCGIVAAIGLATTAAIATMAAPLTTARGVWVCLFGLSLVLALCLASTVPHRQVPGLGWKGYVGIGGLCGLAWACGLRGFMAAVVGPESQVTWVNTVIWILLMGTIAGALLGWAEWRRRAGRPRPALTAAPLLFAGVLLTGLLHPTTMFAGGIGGGAIGVPLLGMAGAYALAGKRNWARALCGSLFVTGMIAWAVMATDVGGATFALDTVRGLWATTLFFGLLVTLALAAAIPLRATGEQTRKRRVGAGSRQ